MRILVTGAAGFIGFHLCKRLLNKQNTIIGLDNLNSYYDPKLKKARIEKLKSISKLNGYRFYFSKIDLTESDLVKKLFIDFVPEVVINLAAQAGVRYSFENPKAYIDSNIVGFNNILDNCQSNNVSQLIYASSSSVYGGNTNFPFSESQSVNHPVSLYAATKRSNELMAHVYSDLYKIPMIGLRFFTVYGPWGRPDMALFLFTKAILNGEHINIYNNGDMVRDFTYIDDIVEAISKLLDKPAQIDSNFDTSNPNPATSWAPHRIFNIGNSKPTNLMEYIKAIEDELGIVALKNYLPMQPGDVKTTSADTSLLQEWIKFKPNTSVNEGVSKFIKWYKDFYNYN